MGQSRVARWVRWLVGFLCGVVLGLGGALPAGTAPPARELPSWVDAPQQVYFPATGHNLGEPFLFYWRTHGGQAVFGLPVTEARGGAPGQPVVQYFERAVLEYRPNTGGATALVVGRDALTTSALNLRTGPGTEYGKVTTLDREARVRLVGGPLRDGSGVPWYQIAGSFGTGWSNGEYLSRTEDPVQITTSPLPPNSPRARDWPFQPLPPIVLGALGPDTDALLYFPSSGHTLAAPFKQFWAANGGALAFGLPISEPFHEINPDNGQTYLTQYFEHARLEYHPGEAGKPGAVEPAALGRWAAIAAGVSLVAAPRAPDSPDYDEARFSGPKWIEVNLSEQRMTAWEGDTPVMTTLIRSGKQGWETPPGTYRVFRKVEKEDMTLGTPGDPEYYYTKDVPWIMYFLAGGYAIHGAFWNDDWGTPTSHGCINTPPEFAPRFYAWAPLGTLVWVHF